MSSINITPFYSRGYEQTEIKTISSIEVAKMMGKEHYEILQYLEGRKDKDDKTLVTGIIPTLETEGLQYQKYFIPSTYKAGTREYKCYLVTKMGCELLGNKQQGEKGILFTAKYVERFNQMEQVLQNPYANLSPELQSIIVLDQKQQMLEQQVQTVQQKVNEIEENAKLDPAEYSLVSKRVSSRVYEVQKERQMNLTKKQIGELFRALNRDILEITGVKTRTQLRQKHLNMVLDFINDWYPSRAAMFNINQMSLEI